MKKRIFAILLAAFFFAFILTAMELYLSPCPDVVVTVDNNGLMPLGVVKIPSAGIEMLLYPVHVDTCCDIILWNGGRIHADSEAFAEIELWDWAEVEPEGMVLECVSIDHCVQIGGWLVGWQGIIEPGGDVLIVSGNTVYRFTLL